MPLLSIEQGKDYDEVVKSRLPYKLLENLGHGGSGSVEKVVDQLTGGLFARKVIRIPPEKRWKERQAIVFRNEIKNIRRLGSHRHIISLFATYATEDEFGLILQPVASDNDLQRYLGDYRSALLSEDPTSPDPHVRDMTAVLEQAFGCLATGMSYMHKNRVRHKDVKLQNILIHEGRVVYTDFGYSFDSNGLSRSITDGRPGPMTAKYSAPEVLAYEARDSSSDIYSLGCVFINILSALTSASTPEMHEVLSFADSMDAIHQHIVHWKTSSRTASLPSVITQMTMRDPSQRLCALHIANKILQSPGLSCPECAIQPMVPASECVKISTCVREAQGTAQGCKPKIVVDAVELRASTDKPTHPRGHLLTAISITSGITTYKEDQTASVALASKDTECHEIQPNSIGSCDLSSSPLTPLSTPHLAEHLPRRVATFPMTQHHRGDLFLAQETRDNVEPQVFFPEQGQIGLGRSHTTPGASSTNALLTYLSMLQTPLEVPTILVFHEGMFCHCIPVQMYHPWSLPNTEPIQPIYGVFDNSVSRYNTKPGGVPASEANPMLGVGAVPTVKQNKPTKVDTVAQLNVPLQHTLESTTD